ncbi:MAG TPA: efflux RND transporter periplasmic adaptor subunit [Flavisolibacter sp.]|jgi:membrane fusion protein (multidrug efflux system)|nr:efflux RND transporter periplasmic adaptor subunit [Flavisolibacter sp.]
MKINLSPFYAAVILTVGFAACSTQAADKPQTNNTETPKLPVDVHVVSLTALNNSETIAGSLMPNLEVEIMSEVTKKVVSVAYTDGSFVSKGQLLYKLDDADILAKIRQLHAELQLARINEKRFAALLKTETVRQEEYDAALAKRQTLEASAQYLQAELSKTYIRAPFSGKIGISKVQRGALVSPGVPLVTLQDNRRIKVQFNVSEKYLPLVQTGRRIFFSTELTDSIAATVMATEPGVDPASRNITVQAVADNAKGKLKAGMSARIYFSTTTENARSIILPTHSLIPSGNGYSVFVVKNGMAKMTPVTIGDRNEEEATILTGLASGDTVMVSNILRAMDGTPVQIVNQQ